MLTREQVAEKLGAYYTKKFRGHVMAEYDESKRAYCINGSGLPAAPELAEAHPKGWSLLDYIKPAEARKMIAEDQVFMIEVRIVATAYIKAKSPTEALRKARKLKLSCLELMEQGGEVPISGKTFDNPDLPDVSLSPAMTINGPISGQMPSLATDDGEDDGTNGQDRESYSDDQDRDSYTVSP